MQVRNKLKRAASAFMALVLMLGMLPSDVLQASAADSSAPADTITMDYSSQMWGARYTSDQLGSVLLRQFVLTVNGEDTPGWCNDHSKPGCYSASGYNNPVLYPTNSVATPYLDVYMTQYERNLAIREASGLTDDAEIKAWLGYSEDNVDENGKIIDASKNQGAAYGWGDSDAPWYYYAGEWEMFVINAAAQGAVWLYASGKLTNDSDPDYIWELVGTERYNAQVAQGYTGNTVEGCIDFVKTLYNSWLNGGYNHYEYYLYTPIDNGSTVQTILIPKMTPKDYSGYIKLKKTDETSQPLAGATFGIYTDEACTASNLIDTITTTTDEWNYSAKIDLTSKTQTLWVKELDAPPGYYPNAKPWSVTVDSTTNNTQETAAAVNNGTAIKNVTVTDDGVVYKVDVNGNPIGPVTFRFVSLTNDVDRTISSDSGVITLQWLEEDEDNYIEPGEYRVTEEYAPPGYVKSNEAQNIKFWIEWDDEGLPILMNSGPLTFTNEQKRKVVVKKVDGSGNPLAGANFDIYKDGTKIGSDTTGRDGSFTYAGLDGNGLDSGYYEFVETSALGGYLVPTDNTLSVTIDTSDTSQPEVIELGPLVNYEYPEIRIRKLINGTDTGLVGAVFQVRIDGKMLDGTFTADNNGLAIITYDKYGKFLDDRRKEKRSHRPHEAVRYLSPDYSTV